MNWLPLRAFRAQIFARSKRRCRCPRCREAFIGSALRPDSPPVGQSPGSARRRLLSAIESRSREDLRSLLARDAAVGADARVMRELAYRCWRLTSDMGHLS